MAISSGVILSIGASVAISAAKRIQAGKSPLENVVAGAAVATILVTVGSVTGAKGTDLANAVGIAILSGVIVTTFSKGTDLGISKAINAAATTDTGKKISSKNPNPAANTSLA